MPLDALGLVLGAALLHALWNRMLHGGADRVAAMAVAGLATGAVLLPATVAAPPRAVIGLVVASAAAEAVYALFLSEAYRRGALSVTYPIGRGTAPLLVTLGAWVVLAERPAPATVGGALALAGGLLVVAGAGRRAGQGGAIVFALLTGTAIATYSLIDARAVRETSAAGYIGAVMGLEGLLLVGWLRGDLGRLRRAVGTGVRIGMGSAATYLLVLLAYQRAEAGRVATLREVSVLIGLALAVERPGRRVWGGAALVVAGAILAGV